MTTTRRGLPERRNQIPALLGTRYYTTPPYLRHFQRQAAGGIQLIAKQSGPRTNHQIGLDSFGVLNVGYVLELYDRYRRDPESVDPATRAFFATWTPAAVERRKVPAAEAAPTEAPAIPAPAAVTVAAAVRLAQGIRERGHLAARLDPLGTRPIGDPSLDPASYGLSESDLASLPATIVVGPVAQKTRNALEAIRELRRIYSGTTGYEFEHVTNAEEREWLRFAIESDQYRNHLSRTEKIDLLRRLTEVETFERFLHRTFVGQKRFSIEGTDVLVPMLDGLVRGAAMAGAREVVIGMAHRGRLNVLAHVLGKPYSQILAEFHEPGRQLEVAPTEASDTGWTGDVKYHLGARRAAQQGDGGTIDVAVTLAPNPSHLEFVDPVVEGMTRALQEDREHPGAPGRSAHTAVALLVHGDAAFPGEGVVSETLNLAGLSAYTTDGTIHIIANNQLGFTTTPAQDRSTLYASDLAKGFEIPIVHVNADDPAACLLAIRLAHDFRERFHKDFLIDLVGYRRWGHNEADEPTFTQPIMYRKIADHPSVREIWARTLVQQGVIGSEEAQQFVDEALDRLRQAQRGLEGALASTNEDGMERTTGPRTIGSGEIPRPGTATNRVGGRASKVEPEPTESAPTLDTGYPRENLVKLNTELTKWPSDFHINPRLVRLFERRREAVSRPGGIDWAQAEMLAFATILADGRPIRLTGQDTERGTFSQRHAVLHDVETGETYTPLQHLSEARAAFTVYNTPLSETAPLGFEYGYSVHAPDALVLWEAQFGDFANAAQVIIDQFIVSGEAKWGQRTGLVLLLPHGYEGQGPEHSSARLERFLQLGADDNMQIANCTTAAQYFHLLRRQVLLLRSDPRPLVVMTPKSLLRLPASASSLDDLATGRFQPVLGDRRADGRDEDVERLIACSGKVYYDLVQRARELAPEQAARLRIVRVEQLFPFPERELLTEVDRYRRLGVLVWAQEEPMNMGAWRFVEPRLRELAPDGVSLVYAGRPEQASSAAGSAVVHEREQAQVVATAVGLAEAGKPGVRHVA